MYASEDDGPNIIMYNADVSASSMKRASRSLENLRANLNVDGNTVVIYGHDIDVNYYHENLFQSDSILKIIPKEITDEPVVEVDIRQSVSESDAISDDEIVLTPCGINEGTDGCKTETYAILAHNNGGAISLKYYTINYPKDMLEDDLEFYYSDFLETDNLQNIADKYAVERANGTIVKDVQDDNTAVRYYTPVNSTKKYAMTMYKKDTTIQASKASDDMADRDFYYFIGYCTVTPGNSLSQQYPEYKNAIVVTGAQTDFWLDSTKPNDAIVDGTPLDMSIVDMKSGDQSCSLSVGLDGTVSLSFNWAPTNPVRRSSMRDARRFNNAYFGNSSSKKYCISTSTFTYNLGCYVRSYGSKMSANGQNCVRVYFQNQSTSDMEWITDTFSLSYDA